MNAWKQTVPDCFPTRFFISYSSFDTKLAQDLERALSEAGHIVWRDRTSLVIGDRWKAEVDFAIAHSDEIVVLLTPASANSAPVLHEITSAIRNNRRVNLFATFELRERTDLYALISEVNYVLLRSDELTVDAVVQRLLGTTKPNHPLGVREFEWLSSRRVFPLHDFLYNGHIERATLNQYLSFAAVFSSNPGRANGVVWTNLALCAALAGEQGRAADWIRTASGLLPHPTVHYFEAALLLKRNRPRHAPPEQLDRCIALATSALQERRSPLVALLLCALLADGQRASGQSLAALCAEALDAIEATETQSSEVLRFTHLLPITEQMAMPVPTNLVLQRLRKALGE